MLKSPSSPFKGSAQSIDTSRTVVTTSSSTTRINTTTSKIDPTMLASSSPTSPPLSPTDSNVVKLGLKRMIKTLTRKEETVTRVEETSAIPAVENVTVYHEPGLVVSITSSTIVTADSDSGNVSPSASISYPGTINAKFVKKQAGQNSVQGLSHALKASIEKSSAAQQAGRLFDGGILTSANHKKWYHATIPATWIRTLSSEHHYGNYVVTDRKTSATVWEDMPIFARIGMHLLFACMVDHRLLHTKKIRHLFSAGSIKQGKHFDAPESVAQIPHFIKTYKLDLSELLEPDITRYKSFNEFFYRKLRPDTRPIHEKDNPNVIVSAADCRFCVFDSVTKATEIWIKGKSFSLQGLVRDEHLAQQFEGGAIALFRLAPQDYHRFHSPVQGTIEREPVKIEGTYFTVNPMAVNETLDVFTENVRKVTLMNLDQQGTKANPQFDQCIFVSVGALLVGSIELTGAKVPGTKIQKGDELGYFAYGGSTCILLFKKGAVQFDQDLLASSEKGLETLVRMGERIGIRV